MNVVEKACARILADISKRDALQIIAQGLSEAIKEFDSTGDPVELARNVRASRAVVAEAARIEAEG